MNTSFYHENNTHFPESDIHISGKKIKNLLANANYCYHCYRCNNVCPLSHLGVFYPQKLIAGLVFSSNNHILKVNNIWECLTCGQCTIYCPMTHENVGVRIPELILQLRMLSIENQKLIEENYQYETHDNIMPLIARIMAENPLYPNKLDFLKSTKLKTTESGEIAYFVGCLPIMEEIFYNLNINYVSTAVTIISLLNESGIVPVVLNEKCCGHDLLWGQGDMKNFKELAKYNIEIYREAGVKTIILGCAEGYRTWKFDYPKVTNDFDFEVLHFSEFILKEKILESVRFPKGPRIKVTYHDSCRLGRMGDKLYEAPRELIKKIPGVDFVEMRSIKNDALCCGVSTFKGCNEFTRILRQNRINEAIETGADYLIVPCPKCLTHFSCYINEPSINSEQKEDKTKIKVVDLASFIGKLLYIS